MLGRLGLRPHQLIRVEAAQGPPSPTFLDPPTTLLTPHSGSQPPFGQPPLRILQAMLKRLGLRPDQLIRVEAAHAPPGADVVERATMVATAHAMVQVMPLFAMCGCRSRCH